MFTMNPSETTGHTEVSAPGQTYTGEPAARPNASSGTESGLTNKAELQTPDSVQNSDPYGGPPGNQSTAPGTLLNKILADRRRNQEELVRPSLSAPAQKPSDTMVIAVATCLGVLALTFTIYFVAIKSMREPLKYPAVATSRPPAANPLTARKAPTAAPQPREEQVSGTNQVWVGTGSKGKATGEAAQPSIANAANYKYWIQQGDRLAADNSLSGAETCYSKALLLNLKDAATWLKLSRIQLQRMEYLESEYSARRAIAFAPSEPRVWLALGQSLIDTGRYSEAKTALKKGLLYHPNSSVADTIHGCLASMPGKEQ